LIKRLIFLKINSLLNIDQFFIKYFKDFEKLEPDEKCAIIEEIQFHLQKEYDRNAKIYNQQIG
jgi:hypothetical protein